MTGPVETAPSGWRPTSGRESVQASVLAARIAALRAQAPVDAGEKFRRMTRAIAITSGKGGVGKSNLTANLAVLLGIAGKRVTILDADLGMANVDVLFGLNPQFTLYHVLARQKSLREIMTPGPFGVTVVPGASGVTELADLGDTERRHFLNEMALLEETADVILIDTGAGLGKNVLSFLLASPDVVVVTIPEPPAMADAYGVIKAVSRQNPRVRIHLVVNRVRHVEEALETRDRLQHVATRFLNRSLGYLGHVPEDPGVQTAVRARRPFVLDPAAPLATAALENVMNRLFLLDAKRDTFLDPPENAGLTGFAMRLFGWLSR